MESYFDFIIFLAFERNYDYEDKRSLTYEELHNYRLALIKENIDYFNQFIEYDDEYLPELLKKFHNFELNMSLEEERKCMQIFLNNYKEYFTFDKERIYLKEDVDMESFEDIKFELSFYEDPYNKLICGNLIGFSSYLKPMEALHAFKIKNEALKLIQVEKDLEKCYYEYKIIKNSPNIEAITKFIIKTLTKIGNYPNAKVRSYYSTIACLRMLYDNEDYNNLSEEILKDKFYQLHEGKIENTLRNGFSKAIFSTKSVTCDKLIKDFLNIFQYKELEEAQDSDEEENEYDLSNIIEPIFPDKVLEEMEQRKEEIAAYQDDFEDEDDYEDDEEYEEDEEEGMSAKEAAIEDFKFYLFMQDIDRAFYLRYIFLTHFVINKYGENEDLEKIKSRLLFLLDSYGESLTEEKNFLKVLKSNPYNKFTKEDFDAFYMVARVFLIEILEEYVKTDILKKLIYISTYYLLTKDIVIDRIIAKYENTEIGQKVKKAIYENEYCDFIEKDTKLIKKK